MRHRYLACAVPVSKSPNNRLALPGVLVRDTHCPQSAASGAVRPSGAALLFVFVGGTVSFVSGSLRSPSHRGFLTMMRFSRSSVVLPLVASALAAASAAAQQPAASPQPGGAASAPNVGQAAPDFSLAGATRFGVLKEPVRLADFRGQIVVLAFFPKARTKG